MPIAATLTASPITAIGIAVYVTLGLFVLFLARQPIRQTTLIGPWSWTLAALIAWAGTEFADATTLISSGNLEPLRLATIALSFCPIVAVLGAKRPQNFAWNFVVLSLWAIVTLPAAENFFLHPGQKLSMGDARSWFLWILILLGPINYIPTRFALPSLVVASGQILALSPYLALLHRPLTVHPSQGGLILATTAILGSILSYRAPSRGKSANERLWFDFRDLFGLLWALRVQERINTQAQQDHWNLELTWRGVQHFNHNPPATESDSTSDAAFHSNLRSLLRRFVSPEWINSRL